MENFIKASDFFANLKPTEKVYLLIRHGERRHITPEDTDNGAHVGLTEKGRAEAFALGKLFPADGDALYFSSPVGRCIDTAKCIAEGRAAVGGPDARNNGAADVAEVKPVELLGHYYVKDYDAYLGVLNDQFYQNICAWIDSDNHPAFYPLHERAEEFLRFMKEHGTARFNIFATHDAWVVPTLVHFCGLKFTPSCWMNYLTGVAFVVDADGSFRMAAMTGMDDGYLRF